MPTAPRTICPASHDAGVVLDEPVAEHAGRAEIQEHDAILAVGSGADAVIAEVWVGLDHAPGKQLVDEQ